MPHLNSIRVNTPGEMEKVTHSACIYLDYVRQKTTVFRLKYGGFCFYV